MSTRNIFQKICPACMSTLAIDTRQCACGHDFDHDDATDASLSSEEIRVKAEELYESYLAARAQQAADAAKTARAEFAREPSNPQKAERMAIAADEARAADAALTEQSARIAEMKKSLPPRAQPRPTPVVAEMPKKKAALAKPAAPAIAARKTISAPAQIAKPTSRHKRKAITVTPAATESKPSSVVVSAKPQASPAEKPKSAVQAVKSQTQPAASRPRVHSAGKSKPVETTVEAVAALAPVPVKPQPPQPVVAETPNPAFREAQAAKAEKILRPSKPTETAKKKEERREINTVPKKEPELPALSSSKSAPRLLVTEKKKECPNCTGSVDNHVNRCRCGYEFPSSETLIPPLAMSEEERAELAKLFGL